MSDSCKDIFISYRREDNDGCARAIAKGLEKRGYSVFFDTQDIAPGMVFPNVINNALKECRDFIVIVSKSYFGADNTGKVRIADSKDWCRNELISAISGKKHIIPIAIDKKFFKLPDTDLSDDPCLDQISSIFKINYLEYSNTEDSALFFNKLESCISDESRYKSKLNRYTNDLIDIVARDDASKINIELRKLVIQLSEADIDDYLYPLLDGELSDKVKFYTYYAIFTFYRRMEYPSKICTLVKKYGDRFSCSDYLFNNIVLSRYYFCLYENKRDNTDYLDKAIEYAKQAVNCLSGNSGVHVTYAELIVYAIKANEKKYKDLIPGAIEEINHAMELNKGYPKHYYILGMLEGVAGEFSKGIDHIKKAVDLEDSEEKDAYIRIVRYYDAINDIKIRQLENRLTEMVFGTRLKLIDKVLLLSNDSWGEDRVFHGRNYWGVVDGATPIDRISRDGFMSQAEWLVHSFISYLDSYEVISDFKEVCRGFVRSIENSEFLKAITDSYNIPSATVAVAIENEGILYGYVLGDCGIEVYKKNGEKLTYTDSRVSKFSNLTLERKNKALLESKDPLVEIKKQKIENRKMMNVPDGYWTLSTYGDFCDEFVTFSVPVEEVDRCLIFSDGFTQICKMEDLDTGSFCENGALSGKISKVYHRNDEDQVSEDEHFIKKFDDVGCILIGS